MSLHYEVVFSVDLRDNTPPEVLEELRWHLGLTDDKPAKLSMSNLGRVLQPAQASYLPGGELVRLERYLKYVEPAGEHYVHGLFARLYWLDDQFADCWHAVVKFVRPHIESDGYAGFFREEGALIPEVLVFRDGHGYLLETNGIPKALENDGPAWTRYNSRGEPE